MHTSACRGGFAQSQSLTFQRASREDLGTCCSIMTKA
jgi:hypothetical protein